MRLTNVFKSFSIPLIYAFQNKEVNLFKHSERKHHSTLFLHYRFRSNLPNLRRTTRVTVVLKRPREDGRKLTKQALGTTNCIQEYRAIFRFQANLDLETGLAGE